MKTEFGESEKNYKYFSMDFEGSDTSMFNIFYVLYIGFKNTVQPNENGE